MVSRDSLLFLLLSLSSFLVSSEVEIFGKSFLEDITMSARDKEVLDIFKSRVSSRLHVSYMKNEFFLIRWLRGISIEKVNENVQLITARNFDLDEAERMLIDHLHWRDDNRMDTIVKEDWSDFAINYPFGRFEDKYSRPVLYLNFGDWDVRKAAVTGKMEHLIRYTSMILEAGVNYVRKLGKQNHNVSQAVLVVNNQGFNAIDHGCLQCLPFVLRVITLLEAHYPGYLNKIIIVNSPGVAEVIADAARRFFHPETNRIFRVYGRSKNQWGPVLEKYFDKSQLPVELGGSKEVEELTLEQIRNYALPY